MTSDFQNNHLHTQTDYIEIVSEHKLYNVNTFNNMQNNLV